MFIKSQLEQKVNEILFKDVIKDIPEVKEFLPYKNVTVEQNEQVIKWVYDYRKDLTEMIKDVHFIMTGVGTGFLSKLGKTLMMKKTVMETKVIRAINEAMENSEPLKEMFKVFQQVDPNACVVGGCVRDSILGKEPKDWDFVSGLDYDVLEQHFKDAGFVSTETGKQFLVLNVSKGGENFEVALFRKDGTYEDGRRPESVEVGTIEDDAQRRDFTVNALYFNFSQGLLLDPNGTGLKDIHDNVLRFVGKPEERLKEDSLRAIRFYRFLQKGFTPDTKSLRAVRTEFDDALTRTTPERVRAEIEKIVGL